MQLAILMGFEMGTHAIPFLFDSPLCWVFWACLLLSFGVQLLLQRKKKLRFVWVAFLLVALMGSEIACQIIAGWDLLGWVVLYFYVLTMLTGALLGMALRYVWQRRGLL